jgi:peptidoglycan/LPS O-acetylase OafA/YrhL
VKGTTIMTLSQSEPTAPAGTLGYRRALDGVRGLAIVLVVLSHSIGFPATAFSGVELFFVLSGFLITTLLLEEHSATGRVAFAEFYRRRAFRLLPALVALLASFLVYSIVAVLAGGGSLERPLFGVAAGLGYFTNISLAVDPTAMPNELRHLWSLAIEEQFYIVWPPVLFLVLRGRKGLALAVLTGACLFSVAQQIGLYLGGAEAARISFGTDTRSTSILVGCIVAIALLTSARPALLSVARTASPLAIACFVGLLTLAPGLDLFSAWVSAFALCCACLVVVALDDRSALARVLAVSPLVFLGRISYSLYLWHVALFWAFDQHTNPQLMDLPVLALSIGFAVASYYLVEMPFLRRRRRPRQPTEAADPKLHPAPALNLAGS